MYMCIGLAVPRGEDVVFDHVVFAFAGTSVQVSPTRLEKTCLDLPLISYNNILKKKDINVQVKLTSFYFLEKDRKTLKQNKITILSWFLIKI